MVGCFSAFIYTLQKFCDQDTNEKRTHVFLSELQTDITLNTELYDLRKNYLFEKI